MITNLLISLYVLLSIIWVVRISLFRFLVFVCPLFFDFIYLYLSLTLSLSSYYLLTRVLSLIFLSLTNYVCLLFFRI